MFNNLVVSDYNHQQWIFKELGVIKLSFKLINMENSNSMD